MEPFSFVIAAVGIVAAWTLWRVFSKAAKEPLDKPEHEVIYNSAVKHVTDPVKLNALADAFNQAGKPQHAKALNALADTHAKKAGKPKRTLKRTHAKEVVTHKKSQADAPEKKVYVEQAPPVVQPPPTDTTDKVGKENGDWESSGL